MRPGQSSVYSSHGSSDYDTKQYKDDLKKFRNLALGSQEYGASSEYSEGQTTREIETGSMKKNGQGFGRGTSDYGFYPSGSSSEGQTTREMETRNTNRNGTTSDYGQGFSGATSDYGLYPSGSSSEGQTTREMEMGRARRNGQGFSGSSLT